MRILDQSTLSTSIIVKLIVNNILLKYYVHHPKTTRVTFVDLVYHCNNY